METLLNVPCLLTIWWWVRRHFLYSVRSTRKLGFATLVQWQEDDGCCRVPLTQICSPYYTMLMYTICDHPVNTVHHWKITFQLNRGLIKLWWLKYNAAFRKSAPSFLDTTCHVGKPIYLFGSLILRKITCLSRKRNIPPYSGHQKQYRYRFKAGRLGMDSWLGETFLMALPPCLFVSGWGEESQKLQPDAAAVGMKEKMGKRLGRCGSRLYLLEVKRREGGHQEMFF